MPARFVTSFDKAKTAADRWGTQYARWPQEKTTVHGKHPHKIKEEILALGPTPDPKVVDRIIGNNSWTTMDCQSCDVSGLTEAIEILDKHSDDPFTLCRKCAIEVQYELKANPYSLAAR